MPVASSRASEKLIRQHYPPGGRYLNVGCGKDVGDPSEGWTNMDAFYTGDPRIVKHDLIRFPWPFKDGEFDVVYASHVLEHVPHVFTEKDGVKRDVIFDLMEEIHRVLKPGGILHLKVPFGKSLDVSMGHPQHYRFWTYAWLTYFEPGSEENYYSSARFEPVADRINKKPNAIRAARRWRIGKYGLTTHLHDRVPLLRPLIMRKADELEAFVRAVK